MNPLAVSIPFNIVVVVLAFLIFVKTFRLYRVSGYHAIGIFSTAFLFYSIAFILKIAIDVLTHSSLQTYQFLSLGILLMQFLFLTMAGLQLAHAFVWKHHRKGSLPLLLISLVIAMLAVFSTHYLYIPQIIVLSYALLVVYHHFKSKKNRLTRLVMMGLTLSIIAWIANYGNYLLGSSFDTLTEVINMSVFLAFFLIIHKHLR